MKVLNMKKLLLVLTLSLFSHSSFSAYKNIKDVCSILDSRITGEFNLEEELIFKCIENKRTCDDGSNKQYDRVQKTKKMNLDDWQKLGCAVILYK
jgi:hypothetical protein